jgi:hypothetical protein
LIEFTFMLSIMKDTCCELSSMINTIISVTLLSQNGFGHCRMTSRNASGNETLTEFIAESEDGRRQVTEG